MRTIEQITNELQGWKQFEATCQEDYDHACLRVRELTAELNWTMAGYTVMKRMAWFRGDEFVPCISVVSWRADEAMRVAGVQCIAEHYYAQTAETGTAAQGFIRMWVK